MNPRGNGHHGANGAAKAGNGVPGIRAKRRTMRAILKAGLEAALRADADVLENCKPKTVMGRLVREMVLEAAKCKATPLKTLMSLIEWEPAEDKDAQGDPGEQRWDWSPEGVWETMPEAEPDESEGGEDVEGPAKRELRRRVHRLMEAGEHEHVARIVEAMRAEVYGNPPGAGALPP